MTLSQRLAENVRACFAGIWIQSCEHEDAILEIAQVCRDEGWRSMVWDIDQGMRVLGRSPDDVAPESSGADPLAAVRALSAMESGDGATLLVLVNFHRFLNSAEVAQAVAGQIHQGKHNRSFVVVLSPLVQIPTELEKLFVCIEHELPDREQLEEIARGIATEADELPDGVELDRVLDAASGLTRYEAEGAFSLSLVRQGRIEPTAIWELKSQTLIKSGLLSLHRGRESFDDLGGLDALKAFCLRAMRPRAHAASQKPRGVLLLGVPGTGKSAFCKALGNETGRPTLTLDVGALMGSLVGQSEERTRRALRIVDAMQPAVLFIDEVEKALSGVASSGQTDSGVAARMFASLLSWLNDHESDVFVVCTANDVTRLPPEFSRAERFDSIFFLDLPSAEQKQSIWRMYLDRFEIDGDQPIPEGRNWTGAEIRACCRLAALLDVPLLQAAQNIVPVAVTAAESVEQLRGWASGRCLAADKAGVYVKDQPGGKRTRRKINRDPSVN